ncbi:MAG: DinB family protein [Chthonomonadales bacterium]|nr:DinB family protein [Chthonomonadales bacterium]
MNPLKQAAAHMCTTAAQNLRINLEAMPADKQVWRPLDKGRSALEQVQECAVINGFFASILRDQAVPEMQWDAYKAACAALDTAEKAAEALSASAKQLVADIEAFPEDRLDATVTLPFHEGMVMTFAQIMFAAYWNMTYHTGQIAYIQTLYGDNEMHGAA